MKPMKAQTLSEEELSALGKVSRDYVPEQERNFDAKVQPQRDVLRVTGTCEINGTHYNIVDWR